ncbi:MAG: ribosome-associated translation inhibitor RaiA [Clostridiaceae bacterium]|nr:ribosome-associated translation inhibitor RaiA [Clostridiaceae bacterium]MBW4859979.1 ribosome-associated translation inhibitor RaiA [Clostridiaceae bacterium]MBW4867069.1 ribosome-associated translation inhibitor RaiA [Clostridiaceae bacterium]
MKIKITGKNMDITDALREIAFKKLGKLDKYFQGDVDTNVTFSVEKDRQIIEVTINLPGTILRAEEYSDDMYTSIDKAVDVLEGQIRKYKTKLQKRYQNGETIRFENIEPMPKPKEEDIPKLVKVKRFAMKPMDAEEAILQMELLRHNFFVFMNGETDEVNVVYKRKDGNYGLIEPEF